MKLVFANIMQELQRFDSMAYRTQPPIPLAILNAATPQAIETALLDEQTDPIRFEGDVFAFSVSTQNARAVYDHADGLRAAGKKVIMGGIHITVCPDEASLHADAIVTGEAETIGPEICSDLLAGKLQARYPGSPTPAERMTPVDYRFFGKRRYLTPASLFASRGCNRRCTFCVSSRYLGPYRTKPLAVLEQEIDQLGQLYPGKFLQFTDDNLLPSCWSMAFRHPNFEPMQLQRVTLQFMAELNKLTPRSLAHVTGIGWRGRGLGTAALLLTARQRSVSQARMLLRQVDEAIAGRSRGRSPGIQVASCP